MQYPLNWHFAFCQWICFIHGPLNLRMSIKVKVYLLLSPSCMTSGLYSELWRTGLLIWLWLNDVWWVNGWSDNFPICRASSLLQWNLERNCSQTVIPRQSWPTLIDRVLRLCPHVCLIVVNKVNNTKECRDPSCFYWDENHSVDGRRSLYTKR